MIQINTLTTFSQKSQQKNRRSTAMTNKEIKITGLQALTDALGLVEAERFVALTQKEKYDYTKWRDSLFEDLTIEDISRKAMELQRKSNESGDNG